MKIVCRYNPDIISEIARGSGAESVKDAINYLRVPYFRNKQNFKCEIIDDVAFFAGVLCKKHFRLYEIAVKKDYQKKGYGRILMRRMKQICKENGINKITLRTSRSEDAVGFYKKLGGYITGIKDNDYEMEIPI